MYLEFDRESESLERAILSAIDNIESASKLNARVESVDATLVGLSDIAELTGLSTGRCPAERRGARLRQIPRPRTARKGNSPLWRWKTIVSWLVAEARIAADSPLVVHAEVLDSLNLALQLRASQQSETVMHYFHGLDKLQPASPAAG